MGNLHGLLSLARLQVPGGAVRTVTTRADVAVTLWVEHGVVELIASCDATAQAVAILEAPGPIPVESGPLHLRNPGKETALVFAALAELDAPKTVWSAPSTKALMVAKTVQLEGLESTLRTWHVTCDQGDFNTTAPTQAAGNAAGRDHERKMAELGENHVTDVR